jgi:hypothetical protein
VGDFDPSGESIFTAMTEDAAEFVKADRVIMTQRIDAVRVALTQKQVELFELPTTPPKKTDKRSENWTGDGTCQLEALAPDLLAELITAAIDDFLDLDTYHGQLGQEHGERARLLALPAGSGA